MNSQDFITFQESKKRLPDQPGVYIFKDERAEILYIGKATSLRDRVRSYFSNDVFRSRSQLIVDMVALAHDIDFIETDSVLEALILEANLIKKYQPKYNTKEKDNKSYNYIIFTDEDYPKILMVRGRTLQTAFTKEHIKYSFGPFPSGGMLKEALKIIRKIFPYSDNKCYPAAYYQLEGKEHKIKPCFNRQIGLCPGVCTGEISKADYNRQVQHLRLFFEGKKKTLIKVLEKDMKTYAKSQEFEKAAHSRHTIFALHHIQDIALLKQEEKLGDSYGGTLSDKESIFRIEAYDVAHISGSSVVGVMTVIEDGEIAKSEYRKFKIRINPGINDIAALKEILRRRLKHPEWHMPNVIVLDGGQAQMNAAHTVMKEHNLTIPLVSVVKDERHKPRDIMGDQQLVTDHGKSILLVNNEAHRFAITYHRKTRSRKLLSG